MDGQQAQSFFPRGLYQPPGSFRFAADALLLSAFFMVHLKKTEAKNGRHSGRRLLDIGTGCGVVALGLLRHSDTLIATGVDVQHDLITAASRNAAMLGFSTRFTSLHVDISHSARNPDKRPPLPGNTAGQSSTPVCSEKPAPPTPSGFEAIPRQQFDLALANPPYRKNNQGRKPATRPRSLALFEEEASLDDFCRAAAWGLEPKGRFGVIFAAPRLPDLLLSLDRAGFGLRRLLPVHTRKEEAAKLVLVESRKDGCHDLRMEAPLVLYEGEGADTRLTGGALAFCPALGINSRGRRG